MPFGSIAFPALKGYAVVSGYLVKKTASFFPKGSAPGIQTAFQISALPNLYALNVSIALSRQMLMEIY